MRLALAALGWAGFALPALAIDEVERAATRAATKDCGSVVVRRCDSPSAASTEAAAAAAASENRRIESVTTDLGRVVIEARRERPPSVEQIIAGHLAEPLPSRSATYNTESNDGTRCTCMTRCPPWPLPCCQCSAPPDRPTRGG